MFGIGFQEMLIILVVVLIFFGPKRLPDLAKSLGKGIAEFKKASEEVKKGIDDAMKEETVKEEPVKEELTVGKTASEETPAPMIAAGRKEEPPLQPTLPYLEPQKRSGEAKEPTTPSSQ